MSAASNIDLVRQEFAQRLDHYIMDWSKQVTDHVREYDDASGAEKIAKLAADPKPPLDNDAEHRIRRALATARQQNSAKVIEMYGRQASAEDIADALDLGALTDLGDGIVDALAAGAVDSAVRATMELGLDPERVFNVLNDRALRYAQERGAELVGMKRVGDKLIANPNPEWAITDTTRSGIRGLIERAYSVGMTPADLRGELIDNYEFSAARAKMIAQTEMSFAGSRGQLLAWRESGVVTHKEWHLSSDHPDGSNCDCQENEDAGPIELDEEFPSGDDAPPAHPGCLCAMGSVISKENEG